MLDHIIEDKTSKRRSLLVPQLDTKTMIYFMKMRRKLRFVLITALIVLILYLLIHSLMDALTGASGRLSGGQQLPIVCEVSPKQRILMSDTLEVLVKEVFRSLTDVTYFLCYDSLWGALGVKGPLRWHQTIDICLVNEELVKHDEAYLIRTFRRHKLSLSYQSADGVYLVTPIGHDQPVVRLYLFEQLDGNYRRVGWKNRLIPPDQCELMHCFPDRLIAKPLPTESFMSLHLPVPHEGIEIQKYLFPDSWWLDTEPDECK